MKMLCPLVLYFLFVSISCTAVDPDIPDGTNSYEKGSMPKARASVWELSQYRAVLQVLIESTGDRKLTKFCLCYSETNPLPDTTDYVADAFTQYVPNANTTFATLSDLEPATNYYCRVYLANSDSGSYTSSVVFTTKVPSTDDAWLQMSDLPRMPKQYQLGFVVDDRVFAITSLLYDPNAKGDLIEYLPVFNKWVQRADLPFQNRRNPVAVAAGGKGYAGFGNEETILENGIHSYESFQDWWCYDIATEKWERKTDIPGQTVGMMAAFGIKEKVYVLTSPDYLNSTLMQVFEYDTKKDCWTRKSNFPGEKLMHSTSFVINGRPYVFTGTTNRLIDGDNHKNSKLAYTANMWEYEVVADTWRHCSDFKGGGRELMVATAIDGVGYAGFGVKPVTEIYTVNVLDWWMYDPVQDTWTSKNVHSDWFTMCPDFAFATGGFVYIGSVDDGVWKYIGEEKIGL